MNIWESISMPIGKHEWRMVVRDFGGRRLVSYEWRRRYVGSLFDGLPKPSWRDYHDWPAYDFNDGMFGGMPKSITKLWDRHNAEAKAVMGGAT